MVSSDRIIHLGPKPVSGGSPAKDSMIRGVKAVRTGDLNHEFVRELIDVVLLNLSKLKAANVIRI